MRLLLLIAFATVIAGAIGLGALALEATGLDPRKARFQALSAFSGTGFTTSEAESVVRSTQRRQIISVLIVVGNLGILGLLGALVGVVVRGVGSQGGLAWAVLLLVAVIFYASVLARRVNPMVKRALVGLFRLRPVAVEELAQLPDGRVVFALTVTPGSAFAGRSANDLAASDVSVLAGPETGDLKVGDVAVCAAHPEALKSLF